MTNNLTDIGSGSASAPCPKCGHDISNVLDTRTNHGRTRRRRRCMNCKTRFTTHEVLVEVMEDFEARIAKLELENSTLRSAFQILSKRVA